jgi:hypothetical protein
MRILYWDRSFESLEVTELSVGKGIDLSQARAKLAKELRDHIDETYKALSQTFAVQFERDRAHPNGLVFYAPKMALGAVSTLSSPDGRPIFEPPSVLLDVVDPTPRVDMPAAKDPKTVKQENNLLIFNPARSGFKASELYRPEIVIEGFEHYFRAKLEVIKEPLAYADGTVLRLTLQNKLEPEEWRFISPLFESLSRPEADPYWKARAPAIWVALGVAESLEDKNQVPVAETIIASIEPGTVLPVMPPPGLHGNTEKIDILLHDKNELILECLKKAASAASKRGQEESRLYLAEFVVRTDFRTEGEYANLWQSTSNRQSIASKTSDAFPLFMLNGAFTSRVSRSVERLTERFQTTLSPSPWATSAGIERIQDHFANFNKLRLAIKDTKVANTTKFLTYPDALVNLTTKEDADPEYRGELVRSIDYAEPPEPDGPHYTYLIPHIFAQEIADDPKATENMRFEGYRDAGRVWQLTGNIEHQYSYRFPFIAGNGKDDDGTLKLQLTTDIRHPSELSQRGVEGVIDNDNERKQSKELRNLIAFDHRNIEDKEHISIFFLRNALRTMLIAYENIEQQNSGGKVRPAQLRELYESLMDLRFALSSEQGDTELNAGDLTLLLERWNFDNDNPIVSQAEIFGLSPYPSISANMLCVETGTLSLRQLAVPKETVLNKLNPLLDGTFDNFVEKLRSYSAIQDAPGFKNDAPWLQLDIPIERSGQIPWKWEGQSTSSLYENTNAIRVGLTLKRPARVVADDTYGEGSFFGMTSNQADISRAPALKGENFEDKNLRDKAKKELAEYFDRDAAELSPLHRKFMWLPSLNIDPQSNPTVRIDNTSDPDQYDPQRYKRLFGEVLPVLNFPTGKQRAASKVVNLYYMPHAFRPLQAHPSMQDAKTTIEFAQFLVRAVGEIASSRLPSEIGLKKEEKINPDTAIKLRNMCRELIEMDKGIADNLSRLVTFVDDKETILKSWQNPAEKEFFTEVYAIHDKLIENEIRPALRKLFARDPNLFETAKGFGIGLFDDKTFSTSLYDIQLSKKIRRISSGFTNAHEKHTVDTDSMSFAQFLGKDCNRFFIDVLDDKSYDNEFEIDQNIYETLKPNEKDWLEIDYSQANREQRQVTINPEELRIKTRGALLGRTAEDHIEQDHHFKTAKDDVARSIELNVVHYNPEWRIKGESNKVSDWLYILPSRWLPPMPVVIRPEQDSGANDGSTAFDEDSPWRSPIRLDWTNPSTNSLNEKFKEQATKVLDGKPSVFLPSTGADGGMRTAKFMLGSRFIVDGDSAKGWHHIESYLSHYYFIIDADEEGISADKPFSNDAIEIFTEVADTPFNKVPRAMRSEHKKPVSELHKWFLYSRRLQQGTSESVSDDEKQKEMALADVVAELTLWFKDFTDPKTFTEGKYLLEGRNNSSSDMVDINVKGNCSRYWFSGDKWVLKHQDSEGGANKSDVGKVIAAEIFRFDEQEDAKPQQYVLRVTVLDEPWTFTRARISVRRNFRDVDGNNDPDINPVFVLTSPLSEWSDYGLQPLEIGPADFERWSIPKEVSTLLVKPDSHENVPSLREWYEAGLSDVKSFGPLVKTATQDAKFNIDKSQYTYWNVDELAKEARSVVGTIEQPVHQRAVRIGIDGGRMGGIDELDWKVARQFLNPVDGSTLGDLAKNIKKSETPGTELIMRVTWNIGAEGPVLTVTWPVYFILQ